VIPTKQPVLAPRAYCGSITTERPTMSNATNASRHRGRLHVLRDRLQRAVRDVKRGVAGAKERVASHTAKRAKYRAANP
jgi:hypothetical protein